MANLAALRAAVFFAIREKPEGGGGADSRPPAVRGLTFGLLLVFFFTTKISLVFGLCGCHFTGIGLVSVCHFPENGISSTYTLNKITPQPT